MALERNNLPADTFTRQCIVQVLLQTQSETAVLHLPACCEGKRIFQAVSDRTGVHQDQFYVTLAGKRVLPTSQLQLRELDSLMMLLPLVGGQKKKPKGTRNAGNNGVKRELVFKENHQEYALVTKMEGNRRVALTCLDGVKRQGLIRGAMKRGSVNRVRVGDLVLVGLRDYQDLKCDVFHRYDQEEVYKLRSYGELDPSFKLDDGREGGAHDVGENDDIEFGDLSEGELGESEIDNL